MKILKLFLLSLIIPACLFAQGLVEVKHYSVMNGLSQNKVQHVLQDNDGYIWLATWSGLEKFDGYTFKNYKSYPGDSVRLPYNRLTTNMALGGNKTLICQGYDDRIYLFDIRRECFVDLFAYHKDIKDCESISRLFQLDNGVVWAVGNKGDLWRIDCNRYMEDGSVDYLEAYDIPSHGGNIYDIALDNFGNEWIFTDKGYFVYGDKTLQGHELFRYKVIQGEYFYLADRQDKFAKYTRDKGIEEIALPDSVKFVRDLVALRDGRIGILMKRKFLIYNPKDGSFNCMILYDDSNELRPSCVFQDSKGRIWVHNKGDQILMIDVDKMNVEYHEYVHRKNIDEGSSFIIEDDYGQIWAYPSDGFLSFYNDVTGSFVVSYFLKNTIKSVYGGIARVYYIDRQKNLWLGQEGGLDFVSFTNNIFEYINPKLSHAEVRAIHIDSNKRVWIALKDGYVEVYDSNHKYIGNLDRDGRIVNDISVRFGEMVYTFFEDKNKNLWIGTRYEGLFVGKPYKDGYKFKQYRRSRKQPDGINCNAIYSVVQDKHGRVWIGTYGGGLNIAEGDVYNLKFTNINNRFKRNYPHDTAMRVRYVCPLDDEDIILAATTDGLVTFSSDFDDPSEIVFYVNHSETNRESSISDNNVMHILKASDERIYVSTFSCGLCMIKSSDLLTDRIEFKHFNRRTGLSTDVTLALVEDGMGQLWILSEDMVCSFFPDESRCEIFNKFNTDSDVILSEAIPQIDDLGRMYIGSTEGVLCINLKKFSKSGFKPDIVFDKLGIQRSGGGSLLFPIISDSIVLESSQRNVTLSFSALDFKGTPNIEYAYRIDRQGNSWNYIGNNRSINLVNLSSGDFVLEVKSTNCDGVWVENGKRIHIHVTPSFWETGWALLLYIVFFLLILIFVTGLAVYIWGLRKKVDFEQQLADMKLRFFTDISHELRTPLTLIEGPVEEVIKNEKLSPEGEHNMYIAKRNIGRMLKLISQILDFRKIQNNKMNLYIEQVDLVKIVSQAYNSFEVMSHHSGINFSFKTSAEKIVGYTDVDKLEKIIFNLLSNAFKYTPAGKSVNISIEDGNGDDNIYLSVHDEGNGIDSVNLERLFERFETFGRDRLFVSTGIGLSLVKELVDLLHARINVESKVGYGSTFTVSLPKSASIYKNDPNVEFVLNDGDGAILLPIENSELEKNKEYTILVVEDNAELRMFLSGVLSKSYNVIEADNGSVGLDLVLSKHPDMVVTDVMMPEMDGIELLSAIRNSNDTCHLPVIILSAKVSVDDRIKGMECGADDYITKPFSSSYLLARLRSVLKQREYYKDYLLSIIADRAEEDNSKANLVKMNLDTLSPSLPVITHFDEEFIKNIIKEVEDNLNNPDFKIDLLADKVNMGRSMFYRKIKSILGVAPIDLVKDMRIKRSLQLLESGEYSVSEVAYMCGFTSPQYFSRVFKAAKRCTPTEYKDQVSQTPDL